MFKVQYLVPNFLLKYAKAIRCKLVLHRAHVLLGLGTMCTVAGLYLCAPKGLYTGGGAVLMSIPVGSVMTVIHDRIQGSIEVQVNGTSYGIVFADVPKSELYAAANFFSASEIRIVRNP